MRKRKSIYQIREQAERLQNLASRNSARVKRIMAIESRYVRNIAQSKRFRNDLNQGRGFDVARSRSYSQNTYMGYNAG